MKIKAQELVSKGYFFNELPPCFSSKEFGDKYQSLFTKSKLNQIACGKSHRVSECIYYSVPKSSFNRRVLGIPNPLHYSALSQVFEENTTAISRSLNSKISCSLPTVLDNTRAFKTMKNYSQFRRHCFIISEETTYELKVDISRYYPTIYTHIIPWALHGKLHAKKNWQDNSLLGNKIDKYTRALQSGQTMGIPIGPDVSLLISEMIGCKLDQELLRKFPKIKAARYIDDYYFYSSSKAEAESILKFIQSLFSDYLLTPNEEKTKLKEFPFSTDPLWIISLRSLKATCFKNNSRSEQEDDIRQFFSAAFDWAEKYPKDEVLKYAAKTLYGVEISDANWDYYQAWLIKMGLYDPYALQEICAILYTNRKRVEKTSIKLFIHELLEQHTLKRHSFEVSWTLWLAKILSIKINNLLASKLFDSEDVIPTLIALHLKEKGLIRKSVSTAGLNIDLNASALHDGRWLLAYEAKRRGWLKPRKSNVNFIKEHPFFSILESNKISFFDEKIAAGEIPTKPFLPEEELEAVRRWFTTGSYRTSL